MPKEVACWRGEGKDWAGGGGGEAIESFIINN